ncbi:MAG: tRNA (adenosine(37)-N6)-threonylcarbamoyltransferase complex ATPase subunit type 1 TsaE [Firmicutes bacterium]|nr:tRNA (adenosine(37)-N6)-threonylcarbamoyltransferase complex ATPase subunit type 1 TsaE [Bacillota bacterium]
MKETLQSKTIILKNETETEAFGLMLAQNAEPGDVIGLVGDLGTGKTALSKYIARGLGVTETVSSPTFNIVKEYSSGRLPLYHFDVYRLSDGEELLDIGGDEFFDGDGLCIVEWADIVLSVMPEDAILIRIEYTDNDGERMLTIC